MVIQRNVISIIIHLKWVEMSVKNPFLYSEGRDPFNISNFVHHLPNNLAVFSPLTIQVSVGK